LSITERCECSNLSSFTTTGRVIFALAKIDVISKTTGLTKHIHQIWLQGEAKLPPNYAAYSKKYKELNPGWQYTLWDENSISELITTTYPHLLSTWEGYEYWVMRVDLGKYAILNSQAGLLIDMDTEPLRPFSSFASLTHKSLRSFDDFLDMTHGEPTVLHHANTFFRRLIGVKKVTNNNFIYIPYPNHPFTALLLKRACCTAKRMPYDFKFYYILGSIGPLFLIDTIEDYDGKVTWVPARDVDGVFFKDDAANSWNKSWFDLHDAVWGTVLVVMIVLVVYGLYSAGIGS